MSDALFLKRLRPIWKEIPVTVTRPNDTTAYVVGDTFANATSAAAMLTFANAALYAGGAFELSHVRMVSSNNSSTVKPDVDLYLLNATLATPPVDNAAWAPSDTEALTVIDHVLLDGSTGGCELNSAANASGNILIHSGNSGRVLGCAAGSTSLYGVPRIGGLDGYTPVALEAWTVTLCGWQIP